MLSRLSGALAILTLLLASNPMFAGRLARSLESQYPQMVVDKISEHDVIVVLGGGLRLPLAPAQHVQLGHASDRYWHATRLYRAGKAQRVIISGGNVYSQAGIDAEAIYAKALLQEWGVPDEAILLETQSRTTEQNQRYLVELIAEQEIRSILLVTSALHMPRAYTLFEQLPVIVTPASADVLVRERAAPKIFKWLPSASAFELSTVALHEYYGMAFARILSELKVLKFSFWCPSCTTQAINSSPS